jgi:hypothetical protein
MQLMFMIYCFVEYFTLVLDIGVPVECPSDVRFFSNKIAMALAVDLCIFVIMRAAFLDWKPAVIWILYMSKCILY